MIFRAGDAVIGISLSRPPDLSIETVYALRHTFASFAIAAGVWLFELSRFMGTSVSADRQDVRHLSPDALDRTRSALDAFVSVDEPVVQTGESANPTQAGDRPASQPSPTPQTLVYTHPSRRRSRSARRVTSCVTSGLPWSATHVPKGDRGLSRHVARGEQQEQSTASVAFSRRNLMISSTACIPSIVGCGTGRAFPHSGMHSRIALIEQATHTLLPRRLVQLETKCETSNDLVTRAACLLPLGEGYVVTRWLISW